MHATGVVLVACAVTYWFRLQGTPAYVAMRGAQALFSDPSRADGLPWQPDEMKALGYDNEKAVAVLKAVQAEFLKGAKLETGGEFLQVTGKDGYIAKVRTPDGKVVDVPIVVIDQSGRGVIQLSDLLASARVYYFEVARNDPSANESVLNSFSERLIALGIEGYYDVPFDEIQKWKNYEPETGEVAIN